jgi:hypothetical protein
LRLVNKAGSINAATAQTYVARTKRLISDYQAWLSDPRSFKPSMRRTRGPARAAGGFRSLTPTGPRAGLSLAAPHTASTHSRSQRAGPTCGYPPR